MSTPAPSPTQAQAPAPASESAEEAAETRSGLVRTLTTILLNVSVLTALLVYFGWVRSDRMAAELGIDESILQMSVEDYLLRSVRSVFVPVLFVGLAALAWVGFDRWWTSRRARDVHDPIATWFARWMWAIALGVIIGGFLLGYIGLAWTFIAGPLIAAGGLLLIAYGFRLRSTLPGVVAVSSTTEAVFRGATALLVAVGVFYSAHNYAIVEGTSLAADYERVVATLPGVEVDSAEPLDLTAPGVVALCTSDGEDTRYRYTGLRLLDRTGENYWLVSDGWTREYGAVMALPTDGDGTRFTFVRDMDGQRDSGVFAPCDGETAATAAVE